MTAPGIRSYMQIFSRFGLTWHRKVNFSTFSGKLTFQSTRNGPHGFPMGSHGFPWPHGVPMGSHGVPMASMENPRMSEIVDFNENHNSVRQKIGDAGSRSMRNIFPLHPVTSKPPESPYGAKYFFLAENPVF